MLDMRCICSNYNQALSSGSGSGSGVEGVTFKPIPSVRSGVTILAFSSYPNGFPVLDLDDKTAKKMVEKALPSVSVEEKRLLFGRTKWQGRTVGAVVYPISEQDIRQVQNMMNDTRLSNYERNMKINDYMPIVMSKDTGATRIFDIQRNKLLGIQEAEDLSKVGHVGLKDANKQAEKITKMDGAASTQAVKEKEVLANNTSATSVGGRNYQQLAALKGRLVQVAQANFFPKLVKPSVASTVMVPSLFEPVSPPFYDEVPVSVLPVALPLIKTNKILSSAASIQPLPVSVLAEKMMPSQPFSNRVVASVDKAPLPVAPSTGAIHSFYQAPNNTPNAVFSEESVASPPTFIPIDFYAVPLF